MIELRNWLANEFGAKIAVFRPMGVKDQETVGSIVADMRVGRVSLGGSRQIEKESNNNNNNNNNNIDYQ